MKPYQIKIKQGTSFHLVIEMKENDEFINLADHTALMKVRQDYHEAVLVELTTENNRIKINEAGTIELVLTAEETATFQFKEAIYDLLLTNSYLEVSCVISGKFLVEKTVSK